MATLERTAYLRFGWVVSNKDLQDLKQPVGRANRVGHRFRHKRLGPPRLSLPYQVLSAILLHSRDQIYSGCGRQAFPCGDGQRRRGISIRYEKGTVTHYRLQDPIRAYLSVLAAQELGCVILQTIYLLE